MDQKSLPHFSVGTIVWLKSGGPPLTVTDLCPPDSPHISVEWFAGDVLRRDTLHKDSLTTEMPNGRS